MLFQETKNFTFNFSKKIKLFFEQEKHNDFNSICNFFNSNINLNDWNIEIYKFCLNKIGIDKTWEIIFQKIKNLSINDLSKSFFDFDNLSFVYEFGLAYVDKTNKKKLGKYYTPQDVSEIMSELLIKTYKNEDIIDVACGTGNLIINVLRKLLTIKKNNVINLVKNKKIWLYDIDKLALKISVLKINILLGCDLEKYINVINKDFLDKKIILPKNSFIISNPPYFKIIKENQKWELTKNIIMSKELYSAFYEKIANYAKVISIVTPQSFIVADKFIELRKILNNNFKGKLFNFDNVPCPLFNGQKHGIFNSNSGNSTRATISYLIKNNGKNKKFKVTHLIRFKAKQRKRILTLKKLNSFLSQKKQSINQDVFKKWVVLEKIINKILNKNQTSLLKLIEINDNLKNEKYKLYINTSARYFIVCSSKELNRNGYFKIFAKDEKSYYFLYLLLNSSYCYMWYRMLDGGILYSKKILEKTKFYNNDMNMSPENLKYIKKIIKNESKYFVYKKNSGIIQQSIKFPINIRKKLNFIIFKNNSLLMEIIHKNFEK